MGIVLETEFNDSELKNCLFRLSDALTHSDPLMLEVADIVYDQIAESFNSEIDSDRNPWADLAPSTIANRTRQGLTPIRKLQATGAGEKSIKIDLIGGNVQISVSADYMKYHITGTKKMPKRNFIPTVESIERNERIKRSIEAYINNSFRLR